MTSPTGVTSDLRMPGGRNGILPVTTNVARSTISTSPASSAVTHSSLPSGVAAIPPRPQAGDHVAHDLAAVGCDLVQQIAGLGCYKNRLAVFGDKHALRLPAGRNVVH